MTQEPIWTRNFILITLANLFVFLGFQLLLPVMPVYAAKLGGSDTWAGIVVGIFTIPAVLIRPIAGRLLDTRGRKIMFLAGLAMFIFCTMSYAFTAAILTLVIVRLAHGFSWGVTSTASNTIATDIIPGSRLGEAMGYFGLTSTLSMAVGPALGLTIMNASGFDMTFYVSAVLLFVAVAAACLIAYQKTSPHPADTKQVPRSVIEKVAIPASAIIFFVTLSYGAIVSFIALHAAQRGIENIGLFFTVYAIALFSVRLFIGKIADRRGFSYAIYPGAICLLVATVILALAQTMSMFLIAGIIYGFGFGALQPTLQAMSVRDAAPNRRGAANATFFVGFDLGIGSGAILWGVIAEAAGYQAMYLWSILPIALSLVLYTLVRRPGTGDRTAVVVIEEEDAKPL